MKLPRLLPLLLVVAIAGTPLRTSLAAVTPLGDVSPDPNFAFGSRLYVGEVAVGSMQVDGGSVLGTDGGSLGRQAGSVGVVTVRDAGSKWDSTFITSKTFYVGVRGVGELYLLDGGVLESGRGRLGSELGGSCKVEIDGGGSAWINEGLLVGDRATGSLAISAGATSTSDGSSKIGDREDSTGSAVVSGADSLWSNTGNLIVGGDGEGTLSILDGARVTNDTAWIGMADASRGDVVVSGAGSQWLNGGSLWIASGAGGEMSSQATLSIRDGGVVESADFATIAIARGSTASVEIDGAASRWNHTGQLQVGGDGSGALAITAGGMLENTEGLVGFGLNATGSATVSGDGSLWKNADRLTIGSAGPGNLSVTNEGRVESSQGLVGSLAGGVVSIVGKRSEWDIDGELVAGFQPNVTGRIEVDQEAQLRIDGEAVIGAEGTGTLVITNEAEVDAYGDITFAASEGSVGELYLLSGGVLNMHGNRISRGDGVAHFNLAGGKLKNTGVFGASLNHLAGILAAGASPGVMQIEGDYHQGVDAVLEVELVDALDAAGIGYDFYQVDGDAVLAGELNVLPYGGYWPQAGDTFTVVEAASIDAADLMLSGLAGFTMEIQEAGGRQSLTLVFTAPEPAAALSWLAAAATLVGRRRR